MKINSILLFFFLTISCVVKNEEYAIEITESIDNVNTRNNDFAKYILYTTHYGNNLCNEIEVSIEGFGEKVIKGYWNSNLYGNINCNTSSQHESVVQWKLQPGTYTITTTCGSEIETSTLTLGKGECRIFHYYKI